MNQILIDVSPPTKRRRTPMITQMMTEYTMIKFGNEPFLNYTGGYYVGNYYIVEGTPYTEVKYREHGYNKSKRFLTTEQAHNFAKGIRFVREEKKTSVYSYCPLEPRKPITKRKLGYRKLYEQHYNTKIGKDNQIHHINHINNDNNPSNLIEVTKEQHDWLHLPVNDDLRHCTRDEIIGHLAKFNEDSEYPDGRIHKHRYALDPVYYYRRTLL